MKITYIVILFSLFCFANKLLAQDDCVLKLNEAEKLYEAGNIERIPNLIDNCIEFGFSKENKIQALKLLTLVYLSEDNTLKAEKSLLQLLKLDPEYKINKAIDPVEFIKLFNSFNTAPVFSLGLVTNPGFTMPYTTEQYGRNSFKLLDSKYKANSLSISLGFKISWHIDMFWDINLEPSYSIQQFQVLENTLPEAKGEIIENLNSFNIPLTGTYSFYKIGNLSFYGEAGGSYDLYLSGKIAGLIKYNDGISQPDEEPSEYNTKELRPENNISMLVGAGAKLKLNRYNLQLGVRYKGGFINQGNPDHIDVDNGELLWEYGYIDNKFNINNLSFTLSFNREFYIHRKKPNNQTNYDILR